MSAIVFASIGHRLMTWAVGLTLAGLPLATAAQTSIAGTSAPSAPATTTLTGAGKATCGAPAGNAEEQARSRNLEQIRRERAEVQRQIADLERRLSVLRAVTGTQGHETPRPWPRSDVGGDIRMIEIDQSKADEMIGKVVLIGVSYCGPDGQVMEDRQYFGTVLRIDAREGLVIASGVDGAEVAFPPVLDQYTRADPGTYKLRSMDRSVTDPDYVSTWSFFPRANDSQDAP